MLVFLAQEENMWQMLATNAPTAVALLVAFFWHAKERGKERDAFLLALSTQVSKTDAVVHSLNDNTVALAKLTETMHTRPCLLSKGDDR